MPARYAGAVSGTSSIDPVSGTRNWRTQGGLQSEAMSSEGKSKQSKLRRNVAWVDKPTPRASAQQYQIEKAAEQGAKLAQEVHMKEATMDHQLFMMHA